MKPVNVDRMRKYSAKKTPDQIEIEVKASDLAGDPDEGARVQNMLIEWGDRLNLKYGKGKFRIDMYVDSFVHKDKVIVMAEVILLD